MQTLRSLHKTYGQVVRVGPNEVSVAEWSTYREIYDEKTTTKPQWFYRGSSVTGRHQSLVGLSNKEAHAARRKLQNQSYSQRSVLGNESFIADKADMLVRRLAAAARHSSSGKTADVYQLNGLFSLEVILKCALNVDSGEQPSVDSVTIFNAMEKGNKGMALMAAIPFLTRKNGIYIPGHTGFCFRQMDLWESMTADMIDQFRQNEVPKDTNMRFMLTPMIIKEDTYLRRRLTTDELVEEVMGLLFAGSGTTSSSITYLLYAMAQEPAQQEKLRAELLATDSTLAALQQAPILNAVIKETMRVYPTIISTIPRVLDRELVVEKHLLPVGTFVGMQNYVHHRDPALFPSPDEFLSDRWLADDDTTVDMNAALTPFSIGTRNCIGQNLARAEMLLATSRIFRKLRVRLNQQMRPEEMEMEDRFSIYPKGGRLLLDLEVVD